MQGHFFDSAERTLVLPAGRLDTGPAGGVMTMGYRLLLGFVSPGFVKNNNIRR